MPEKHSIDNEKRLIITTWLGEATEVELINALTRYQRDIKVHPCYQTYNEIVDLRGVEGLKVTYGGIREISEIAVKTDQADITTKLAIIVGSSLAFGLARMYITYRNFASNSNKEIKVFTEISEAHKWIETKIKQGS